jgi:AcrB/AcrD/AcrF family protein
MRTGTRAVAVCAVVCLHAGVAAAQSRVMTLAEVLARAREQAPQIVSARLALEESRGRLAGASLRFQSNPQTRPGSRRVLRIAAFGVDPPADDGDGVGGILALLLAGETWNVSSLVGLIGLFGIAVQNSLVLVTQTRALLREGRTLPEAVREASIGRVRPKLMTAGTATLGLLPMLVLRLHGTEIERPLAVVMIGGLVIHTLHAAGASDVLPAGAWMAGGPKPAR